MASRFSISRRNTKKAAGRRPTGVSRKQKRRHLQCEVLENRLAFSVESPTATIGGASLEELGWNVQSYSSATAEGAAAILANELAWASQGTRPENVQLGTFSIPSDPLLGDQWYLINSGQQVGNPDFQDIFAVPGEDINVAPAWALGYTGEGVTVAVIDTGVQVLHPDLDDNISPTLQFDALNNDNNPNPGLGEVNPLVPLGFNNAHGTAVAGIIAAEANNGIGTTGIAHNATIAPIRLVDQGLLLNLDPVTGVTLGEQQIIDAFRFATDQIDITNNSWGPTNPVPNPDGLVDEFGNPVLIDTTFISNLTPRQVTALRDSIFFGRDGKGVIHVFAAGNNAGASFDLGGPDSGSLDSANYNPFVNSRYTIGVTGVDHDGFYNNVDGTVFAYAETGTSVLVAAPTGSNFGTQIGNDVAFGSGITTTDAMGDQGFNIPTEPNGEEIDRDFLADTDYTSRFNGTSASAAMVSGVIALMLEAEPNLTWRDVQEILVRSARQNAPFETPEVALGATQNTWIVNQAPLFTDPDDFNPSIPAALQTLDPVFDPVIDPAPSPTSLTNGAGYTVSQGRGPYGEEVGYAHGVVDAELAVKLAEQWFAKNQNLSPELSYTTFIQPEQQVFFRLPGAEQSSDDALGQWVPGGIQGEAGFIDYWNEYFADDPFSDPNPPTLRRGVPLQFVVPPEATMVVENIEVKLNISEGTTSFQDNVRVTLVSPTGTYHELNPYFVEAPPNIPRRFQWETNPEGIIQEPLNAPELSSDPSGAGELVTTFTSNRSWGERSDPGIIYDPRDLTPFTGQGWELYMENWSSDFLQINSVEVAFHGSQINPNTRRIQGFVGVDENQDDAFSFDRVNTLVVDGDGDPNTFRISDVNLFRGDQAIDTTQEAFAANVTVVARRASDGVIVDQFITGADGNYYFDLIPDDYIISVDDGEGRTAVEDTLTPPNQLQNFRTEWTVTEEFFRVWARNADLTVPVDGNGVPLEFAGTAGILENVRDINFLLDPGPAAANEVVVSGSVFADYNGDGLFNGIDAVAGDIGVFADSNQNGVLDAGEVLVETDAAGDYTLTVPDVNFSQVINIGVVTPVDWTFGQPTNGLNNLLINPGDVIGGIGFTIVPPAFSDGAGGLIPGFIFGSVFGDENESGARDEDEVGLAGVTVYLDNNNSGINDAGDTVTTTNVNGGYSFSDVSPGLVNVRVDIPGNFDQIVPVNDGSFVANVGGGGTVTGLEFAIVDTADFDYGDLPASYGGIVASANHGKSSFFLGGTIDGELLPQTSPNADGDDNTGVDDEDGITLAELVPGTNSFIANASRNGGYLQTWIDFNGDGDFDDTFGAISERVTIDEALVAGDNVITFEAPDAAVLNSEGGGVFARFRYGVFGLNSLGGGTPLGEVEDYMYTIAAAAPPVTFANGPDFDGDSMVSLSDLLALQRGFGATTGATAEMGDADSDGDVDGLDLFQWEIEFGSGQVVVAPPVTDADFDQDNDVDITDLLALQRGYGLDDTATISDGDATGDADVESDDLAAWQTDFGLGENGAGGPLAISVSSLGLTSYVRAETAPTPSAPEFADRVFDTVERTRGELFAAAREFSNRFDVPSRTIDRVEDAIVDFRERVEDRPFFENLRSIEIDGPTREEIVDALHGLRERFRSTVDDLREEFRRPGEALDDAFEDFGV